MTQPPRRRSPTGLVTIEGRSTVGGTTYGVADKVRLSPRPGPGLQRLGLQLGRHRGRRLGQGERRPKPAVANMSLGGGASSALDTAVTNAIAAARRPRTTTCASSSTKPRTAFITTLRTWWNVNTRNVWSQDTLSLAGYAGRSVRVQFAFSTDSSVVSSFYLDDVSVSAG